VRLDGPELICRPQVREWRLSGSLRGLGTEPRRSSWAWRCPGPTQGEETENQSKRKGGDDDYDHRQSAIVRQSADQQCAEGRNHHLQEPEQPGSSAGDARVDAESGRERRGLAQTIADGADRHRHEQRPRRQLDETPDREHYPRGERQRQADNQETGAADGHGQSRDAGITDHISGHWQQDHQPVGARRLMHHLGQQVKARSPKK
jgi:hypothetical protein